jgi:hypothetical protein
MVVIAIDRKSGDTSLSAFTLHVKQFTLAMTRPPRAVKRAARPIFPSAVPGVRSTG